MEPTNIFFIVTTGFVGVLIILFLIIVFYVWKIMRIGKGVASTVKELFESLKDEGDQVIGASKKFRENVASNGMGAKILKTIMLAAMGTFAQKKKSKKK